MSVKGKGFHRFDDIRSCSDRVLATSVADETEIVWLERRRGRASSRGDEPPLLESPRLTVLVRVVENGRQGLYRTDTPDPSLLESGVRQALAMAKVQEKLERRPVLPTDSAEVRAPPGLLDREISRLDPQAAQELLGALCGDGRRGDGRRGDGQRGGDQRGDGPNGGDEAARLAWTDTRLAICNSHGLRRSAAATDATLYVAAGRGAGSGFAAASARRLADLEPEAIRDRARRRRGHGAPAPLPAAPVPVLLAPEATVQWLNVLNAFAFSGRAFRDGTSLLARHRNVQVFDRKFNLRDDGTAPGLSFPFDFEGSHKRSLDLIVDGTPSTPALSRAQSLEAGPAPTAQAVGGQDALFSHLFLLPGPTAEAELLAAADGGLFVGWVDATECYDPAHLRIRMLARGVRRITGGELAEPVADFVWQESLLGALARLRAVGDRPVVMAAATTPLGGISAPALVLEESGDFRAV